MEYNLVIKELSANTQLTNLQRVTLSTRTSPNSVLYSFISVILYMKKEKVYIWRIAVQTWSRRPLVGNGYVLCLACVNIYILVVKFYKKGNGEKVFREFLLLTATCQSTITSKAKRVTKQNARHS